MLQGETEQLFAHILKSCAHVAAKFPPERQKPWKEHRCSEEDPRFSGTEKKMQMGRVVTRWSQEVDKAAAAVLLMITDQLIQWQWQFNTVINIHYCVCCPSVQAVLREYIKT